MFLTEDPNKAVLPDFTSEEHAEARAHLTNNLVGVDDAHAAQTLASPWSISNKVAKARWATRPEGGRVAERKRVDEGAQRQQALNEQDAGPPNSVILSQYATRKMKLGQYCELHYFTNRGLHEASHSVFIPDPEALVMLPPDEDGLCVFIPAGAIRDPATVVKDEDLTWEEFNEAALRMIAAMKVYGWPTDRIDMHIDFWSALQNHRWRLAHDTLKQRALLLYQAQQRRKWHLYGNTPHGWSLAKINQKVLYLARDELFDEQLVSITLQAPAITGSSSSGASHSRSVSAQKRSASPTERTGGASKRAHTIFPCCAVCLGRFPHRVIECSRSRTWDNRHQTFAERIDKALWSKDGKLLLCAAWQREEGCTRRKCHARHICSGCGSISHGAQQCPRAQES